MAETKRNSIAGKVATPKANPSSTPNTASPTVATVIPAGIDVMEGLSKAIGAQVRIVTAATPAQTLEGTLFTADPNAKLVAINTRSTIVTANADAQSGDYHVIPVSQVQSIHILSLAPAAANGSGTFEAALPRIGHVDVKKLETRVEERVRQLKEKERDRGVGVTREAQGIFDSFRRVNMPIRWHNQEMVVDDSVIISPPYKSEDCKASKDKQQALNHVRRVLEGERRKLKEKEEREKKGIASGVRKGG
ncbi:hypothetical protein K431DRAFT_241593 [Polychaeton citri CBS 116435]|uniref:AD domain-containing protein n=1 Tax=Polychaeton citri CBS 116435 TaxID=1314669 RepID=A0A9P4QCR6_9PEZI|nr:hypothetical protein K431DRAFT_241593 [Polychaeton citri CBS 116435]